jgi:hypothetical protein
VLASRVNPGGRSLLGLLQVKGATPPVIARAAGPYGTAIDPFAIVVVVIAGAATRLTTRGVVIVVFPTAVAVTVTLGGAGTLDGAV